MKFACFALSAALLTACDGTEAATENPPALSLQVVETVQNAPDISSSEPVQVSRAADTQTVQETSSESRQESPNATYNILGDPNGPTELTWDDLMPVGEDEVLAQLYETYYANLRQDIARRSQLLQDLDANNEDESEFDISALISEGAANDTMEQIGTFNVVEELNGLDVRLPGYVVPLDFNSGGIYNEFLLVPYFGACLHTPPPPPNQIVYVKASSGAKVDSIYEPVWVEGTMKTGKFESDTGDSAYELTLSNIEAYEY